MMGTEDAGNDVEAEPFVDDAEATSGYMTFGDSAEEDNDDEHSGDEPEGDEGEAQKKDEGSDDADAKDQKGEKDDEKPKNKNLSRFQEMAALREKAQLADHLAANPEQVIKDLAQMYGIDFGGEQKAQQAGKFEPVQLKPKDDESPADFFNRLIAQNMQRLAEFVSTTQKPQQRQTPQQRGQQQAPDRNMQTAEAVVKDAIDYLDDTHKDWKVYENEMIEILEDAPSLAYNPDKLYRLAKGIGANPSDRAKAQKGQTGKKRVTTTTRSRGPVKTTASRNRKMSLDESWEAAKRNLLKGGN